MPRLQTRSPGSSLTRALAARVCSCLLGGKPSRKPNQGNRSLPWLRVKLKLRCSKLEARRMLYTGLQGSPFPYRAAGLWEGAGVWSPLPR